MRTLLLSIIMLAGLMTGATPAGAATVVEVTGFGTNPGNLTMFRLVPDNLPPGRPVVVALHGCTQMASSYGTNAGWVELAQRWRFTLVLPEQRTVNNGSRCFNWFQPGDTARGQGEAESIAQMVRRTITDTSAERVAVTGLSAGGAMTAALLAAYPDLFTAGGIVAGLPHRCAATMIEAFSCMNPGRDLTPNQWGDRVRAASSHAGPWPAVSIWHGTADFTVVPANQRELVEQWANVHGIGTTPTARDTVSGYPHAVYRTPAGRTVVETYSITTMGHGQPVDPGQCGRAGAYVLDVNICAAGQLVTFWRFDG